MLSYIQDEQQGQQRLLKMLFHSRSAVLSLVIIVINVLDITWAERFVTTVVRSKFVPPSGGVGIVLIFIGGCWGIYNQGLDIC